MNFGLIIVLIAAIIAVFLLWLGILKNLKKSFCRMCVEELVRAQQNQNENMTFFSSYILREVAHILAKQPKLMQRRIITDMRQGNYDDLMEILKNNRFLTLGFMAHFNTDGLGMIWKSNPQSSSKEVAYMQLLQGLMYLDKADYERLGEVVKNLNMSYLRGAAKAYGLLLGAEAALYAGDMYKASKDMYAAVRKFKKYNCTAEEAKTYFRLGEIYRVCAVYDVSHMMLDTAVKLFTAMNRNADKAKVLASMGMLTMGQNQIKESAAFLAESRKIFQKLGFVKSEAEIINQQALNYLIIGKTAVARRYAQKALDIHKKYGNLKGMAQSYDLMSMAAARQKKWSEAIKQAQSAQKYYRQTANQAAYLESLFLEADVCFQNGDVDKAENKCRRLIRLSGLKATSFHVANVYTLLGNIYLKKEELPKAEKWFIKALEQERQDKRYAGMATDYANLAITSQRMQNYAKAAAYADKAIEAAEQSGDDNLCSVIGERVAKIR